ncbi:MAG: hypothetical protein ACAH83_16120 [Alphaproteobacteria bacterium]
MKPRSKLGKAFAIVALAAGIMVTPGVVPPAHAGGSVVAAMSSSQAAARRRADNEALSAVIAAPSEANMKALQARHVVPDLAFPFVQDALKEMNLPDGIKAEQVTEAQRDQLKEIVNNKWRVDYVSASTAKEAAAKGLRADFARYLDACRDGTAVVYTYDTAKQAEQCMSDQLWEQEGKPIFAIGAGVAFTFVGGIFISGKIAQHRQRKQDGPA